MADATIISGVQLTPTHDGETALVIELRFPNGGRSKVQIDAVAAAEVMKRARVDVAQALIGQPWTVLDIDNPQFIA